MFLVNISYDRGGCILLKRSSHQITSIMGMHSVINVAEMVLFHRISCTHPDSLNVRKKFNGV